MNSEVVERGSTWLIVSNENDGHYINHFCSWKEALLEHIKWCKGNANAEMYKAALSGFQNRDKAIEFCNLILDREEIIFMAELNGEEFINEKMFEYV